MAINGIQRNDYVPDTMVRLPGARSTTAPASVRRHAVTYTHRTGGAVGGAVGGAMQVKGNDLQSVLKGLVDVLQKLVEVMQRMIGNGGPAQQGPPTAVKGMSGPGAAGGASAAPAQSAVAASTGSAEDSSMEQRVTDLVNQERAKYGLSPLRYNAQLDTAAERHNATQIGQRTMAHINIGDGDPGSRIRATGFNGNWGENVAVGQRSAEQVVKEWMASPTHRANILNPNYNQIGVSYGTTEDGYPFWAQSFGS